MAEMTIIHDGNFQQFLDGTLHNGEIRRCGGLPRDYTTHPTGFYAGIQPYHSVDMPLIQQSDWSRLIAQKNQEKSWLCDIRDQGNAGQRIPSRDQNGKGYCWAHSGVSAHLLNRARDNQPYEDLSAYAIACQIKDFADEGGWGAQGVDWQMKNGVPTSKTWPQQSMSHGNVNDAMKQESARYKVTGGWIDLAAAQYDRSLTWAQVVTCLLLDQPVVVDYNWWSHSVCACALVDGASLFAGMRAGSGKRMTVQEFQQVWNMDDPVTAGIGAKIWNSWGDSWSDGGMGTLSPSKSVPDGAVAPNVVSASA